MEIPASVHEIRHKMTRYDKLASFYYAMPKYRGQLNSFCYALCRGEISEDKFASAVKRIEGVVDLTRKKNQKIFIRNYG